MAEIITPGLTPEQMAKTETNAGANVNPAWQKVQQIARKAQAELRRKRSVFDDLSDEKTYNAHAHLLTYIANNVCLAPQRRTFDIDDNNRDILRFLLYYFNGCPLAETVFPDKGYKLHNNLLIMGKVGTGKTMLMQVFSEYLRLSNNPNYFHNVSVTQMTNYFTMHNNIDRYTYNEEGAKDRFEGCPMNICLNDIGVENRPFYGIDTRTIVEDFLHARNEIWTQTAIEGRKYAHLTTNLTLRQLKEQFSDNFGRLVDRFKTYNIITLQGESRR